MYTLNIIFEKVNQKLTLDMMPDKLSIEVKIELKLKLL